MIAPCAPDVWPVVLGIIGGLAIGSLCTALYSTALRTMRPAQDRRRSAYDVQQARFEDEQTWRDRDRDRERGR